MRQAAGASAAGDVKDEGRRPAVVVCRALQGHDDREGSGWIGRVDR